MRMMTGLCVVLIASSMLGCGGGNSLERASVKGSVTFDGKPVEKGLIAFLPSGETKGPSSGAEIINGEYEIPKDTGPTPGTYSVEVTANRVVGKTEVQGVAGSQGGLSGAQTADVLEMYIPAKYNTKTTLEAVVESGENEQDFDLDSK